MPTTLEHAGDCGANADAWGGCPRPFARPFACRLAARLASRLALIAASGAMALSPVAYGTRMQDDPLANPLAPEPEQPASPAPSGLEAMGVDPAASPAPAPAAPATSEGRGILERARDRIRATAYASFRVRVSATGSMTSFSADAEALVTIAKAPPSSGNPYLIRVTGTGRSKPSDEVRQVDMAIRERSREWVDHGQRTVFEKNMRDPGGPLVLIPNSCWPVEVFERNPYARPLKDSSITIEESQTVSGVDCHVLLVESRSGKARWFIAKDDLFPRRHERLISFQGSEGSMIMEISDVQLFETVPPDADPAALRVAVPEGYTETRTAQSARVAPPPVVPTPSPGDSGLSSDAASRAGIDATATGDGGRTAVDPATGAVAGPVAPTLAPEFDLPTIGGERVTLASLRGQVLLIDFFGTWSLAAEPWHERVKTILASTGERVRFVPIAVRQRNPQLAQDHLDRLGMPARVLIGTEALARAYGVSVFPAAAVVAADGSLVSVIQGCGSEQSAADTIAALTTALERAPSAPATPKADANPEPSKEPAPVPQPVPESDTKPEPATQSDPAAKP
jgi:hypothetical protein